MNPFITKPVNRNLLKCLLLIAFLFPVFSINLSASSFIGFGTGAGISKTSSTGDHATGIHVPLIAEYEYGPEYRSLWLLYASANYLPEINDSASDLLLFSAGVKYIPEFYFYRSNITETTFKKNNCLGILLLPVTITRDAMNNIAQYGIPSHPFILLDYTLIKSEEKVYKTGFTAGAGITSGLIDLIFKYTQNLTFNERFHRDIYLATIEFTLHVPMQDKFVREKPLVE